MGYDLHKERRPAGRPANIGPAAFLHIRVTPDWRRQVDEFVAALPKKISLSEFVRQAVENEIAYIENENKKEE